MWSSLSSANPGSLAIQYNDQYDIHMCLYYLACAMRKIKFSLLYTSPSMNKTVDNSHVTMLPLSVVNTL